MKKLLLPIVLAAAALVCAPRGHAQTITTLAGSGMYGNLGDGGPATAAQVELIWFVTHDLAGNTYISDNFDHKVRRVDAAGMISTYAGNGLTGYSGDGGPATAAKAVGIAGVAIDRSGNLYFADINDRRIRKVNAAGFISTVGGNGSTGYSGDGGPATAAALNAPYGVAVDDAGNVYFADEQNYRVRKIDAAGIITTIAGNGTAGYSGDGGAATLAAMTPTGIAIDGTGNIYVATNSRVRKITPAGLITTVAGNGIAGYSGDGGPATLAKLNQPVGVAADALGNVYISDQYNNRVRKVSTTGAITTIAGSGLSGYGGDGLPATDARLTQPLGLCLDAAGNVYIVDNGNFRVRVVQYGNHIPAFTHDLADSAAICGNSPGFNLDTLLAVTDADAGQTLQWTLTTAAMHGTAVVAATAPATGGMVLPGGVSYTPAPGYQGNDTFAVRVNDGRAIDTITVYIRVKPLPDTGIITGPSYVCMGTPVTVTDLQPGGTWSTTNAHATITSGGVVTGVTPGTDTIRNTYVLEGCSLAASLPVIVLPVTDTITGPAAVCTGTTIALSGSPAGGTWNMTNLMAHVSLGGIVTGDTAGVDTVIYTIHNACGLFSTTYPVTIIGFTIPGVTITAAPLTIQAGVTDTLVAHITHGGGITYGYQWQIDSTTIPGATDSVFICDTFKNNDSVTCLITNGPCNFATFSWTYIVYHTNSVQELQLVNTLRLRPNPSNGSFYVEGRMGAGNDPATLSMTDMTGRLLWTGTAPLSNGRISYPITVQGVPAGIYLLEVSTGGAKKTMRFVISQ